MESWLVMVGTAPACILGSMPASEAGLVLAGEEMAGPKTLPQQFEAELGAGLASSSGGSTQPLVVLTHLLKVKACLSSQACIV